MAESQMVAHVGGVAPHLENGLIDVTPAGAYAAITETNAKVSLLLRLPAELRAKIWQYALDGHTIRLQSDMDDNVHWIVIMGLHFLPAKVNRFSLLRVSRQIYVETTILPYTLSTFCLVRWIDLTQWLPQMSAHERALAKNIRKLKFGDPCYWQFKRRQFVDYFPQLEKVDMRAEEAVAKIVGKQRNEWEHYMRMDVALDIYGIYFHGWLEQWASGSWTEGEVLTSFR